MTTTKKLDSFRLRDKFNGSPEEIQAAAFDAAKRRAEFAGWEVSEVRPSADNYVTKEGEFTCYAYDIFGVEVDSQDLSSAKDSNSESNTNSGLAARESSL